MNIRDRICGYTGAYSAYDCKGFDMGMCAYCIHKRNINMEKFLREEYQHNKVLYKEDDGVIEYLEVDEGGYE